jgi:hypothetical protein
LDILAIRLVDLFVDRRGDLALKALHARYKPYVDQCLRQMLGPIRVPGLPVAAPAASSRPLREAAGARTKVQPIRPRKRKRTRTVQGETRPASTRLEKKDGDVIDAEWEEIKP